MLRFLTIFFFLSSLEIIAQNFPEMEVKTLDEKWIKIPQSTKGKYALIGLAYSPKADQDLKTWFNPLWENVINPPKSGFIPVAHYDLNTYFIPMLTGIYKSASKKIEKKVEAQVDKRLHKHILMYEGEVHSYKKTLNMPEKDKPYLFVLDKEGKVVYTTSGSYTEGKLEELQQALAPAEK